MGDDQSPRAAPWAVEYDPVGVDVLNVVGDFSNGPYDCAPVPFRHRPAKRVGRLETNVKYPVFDSNLCRTTRAAPWESRLVWQFNQMGVERVGLAVVRRLTPRSSTLRLAGVGGY